MEGADAPTNSQIREDWRRFRRGCLYFVIACAAVWATLDFVYFEFPYIQPGSNIVSDAKRRWSLTHKLFDDDSTIRILAFGNSKTLAAFNPALFDIDLKADGVSGKIQSVNLAIPGERRYVGYLSQLLAAGVRPSIVLIQFPPIPEDHDPSFRDWIRHDKMIVDTLFPFRTMPRDFTLFVFSSIGHGGPSGFYREGHAVAEQMIHDRGYYFLKGQSHFPGDRLPDDYHVPTDTPNIRGTRPIDSTLPPFQRLAALAKQYGFEVFLFPPVYRDGEVAPAVPRDAIERPVAGWPQLLVLGDDYWLMPPRYFSDPVHTNREGAGIYTARLAALIAPVLKGDGR